MSENTNLRDGVGLRSERGPILLSLMLATSLVALDSTIIVSTNLLSSGDLRRFSMAWKKLPSTSVRNSSGSENRMGTLSPKYLAIRRRFCGDGTCRPERYLLNCCRFRLILRQTAEIDP